MIGGRDCRRDEAKVDTTAEGLAHRRVLLRLEDTHSCCHVGEPPTATELGSALLMPRGCTMICPEETGVHGACTIRRDTMTEEEIAQLLG